MILNLKSVKIVITKKGTEIALTIKIPVGRG